MFLIKKHTLNSSQYSDAYGFLIYMERRQFFKLLALSSLGAAVLPGCAGGGASGGSSGGPVTSSTNLPLPSTGKTLLGIDVLQAENFNRIKGLRCGLVTHRAGVNGQGQRTVDVLFNAPGVKLTKLFGPEHGIDGATAAEKSVKNEKDKKTGLPVYSLYGATRRPTPAMLSELDVILVDFQDIGSRSYTYISCMKYVMEACYSLPQPIKVEAKTIITGGQSRYANSIHFTDQAQKYIDGDFKNIHFYKEDVLAHAVTSYKPGLTK